MDSNTNSANIEMWKIKKLIKSLEAARGNGTSMISLIIPPKEQIARISQKLADEYGTASNIKSRVNRLSVLSAITSTQQRLKLYNKPPPNGLVIYCGTVITDEGKERLVNIDLEPFKPINTSLYLCDNKFHTEALQELLESDDKFGFIIMDGNGTLFGTLCGNTREVIHKISVELPKKHGRGGQSSVRFARLRVEKRHNYLRKVAELTTQLFITNDRPNVSGLILAGSAEFKNELAGSDLFDQRLSPKILKIIDVSYGGENGFNQAIELAAECLEGVKFIAEKKLIQRYFDEIHQNTGKVVFGVRDTIEALEMGVLETLIVWENLEVTRYVLTNPLTQAPRTVFLDRYAEAQRKNFIETTSIISPSTGLPESTEVELEQTQKQSLLEWLAENYQRFGSAMEFVTDKSQEGSQFVSGFGGVGGILRYRMELPSTHEDAHGDDQHHHEDKHGTASLDDRFEDITDDDDFF